MWVKKDVKDVLGLDESNYRIYFSQQEYVTCGSSRHMLIPNINELIYELFTTFLWHGETKSKHDRLREYCDKTFAGLIDKCRGTLFWHKFRCPTGESDTDMAWMKEILDQVAEEEPPLRPGVPGFTKHQMQVRNEGG
jgi:hypothetical protein